MGRKSSVALDCKSLVHLYPWNVFSAKCTDNNLDAKTRIQVLSAENTDISSQ